MPSDINPEVIIVNLVNPSFITEALLCEDLVGQELIGSDLFAQICTKRALIKLMLNLEPVTLLFRNCNKSGATSF
jgi:hypothetical protein